MYFQQDYVNALQMDYVKIAA